MHHPRFTAARRHLAFFLCSSWQLLQKVGADSFLCAATAAFLSFFSAAESRALAFSRYSFVSLSQWSASPIGALFLPSPDTHVTNSFVSFWISSQSGLSSSRSLPRLAVIEFGPAFSFFI